MTKVQLANLLEGFVNGTCGDWEWDEFLFSNPTDPEIETIRQHCERLDIEYPPSRSGEFCNDEGAEVLLNYARKLRRESSSQ
jgi:hypothetical protein